MLWFNFSTMLEYYTGVSFHTTWVFNIIHPSVFRYFCHNCLHATVQCWLCDFLSPFGFDEKLLCFSSEHLLFIHPYICHLKPPSNYQCSGAKNTEITQLSTVFVPFWFLFLCILQIIFGIQHYGWPPSHADAALACGQLLRENKSSFQNLKRYHHHQSASSYHQHVPHHKFGHLVTLSRSS